VAAQAAVMRTMNFANPISPAAAATADSVTQGPNPLTSPTPVPPALQGGGPPVPDSLVGHGDGPPPPPPAVVAAPAAPPPVIVGGGGSSGGGGASGGIGSDTRYPLAPPPHGIGSDANFPVAGVGGFPGTYGAPGQQPPPLGSPISPVRHVARARPAARIPATATALAPAGPNAGYYTGQAGAGMGGARSPTWTRFTDPSDPRIFRGGPLARP
jgi:hypothetical protein